MKPCPDPETIAALAEGRLERAEIAELLPHIDSCPRCMRALEGANAAVADRGFRPVWMAAAAMIAGLLVAVPLFLRSRDPIRRLVGLSSLSERSVEPRVAGGFPWAPYRGPLRASDPAAEARHMKLVGTTGELVETAQTKKTPAAQHAAGVALLLTGRAADAIARLREAVERDPSSARRWNDLAAGQYATALRDSRPSLYPEALASADRALQLDPQLVEALFNRALILERLGFTQQARDAWQRYIAADPSSPWADEARARLAKLS